MFRPISTIVPAIVLSGLAVAGLRAATQSEAEAKEGAALQRVRDKVDEISKGRSEKEVVAEIASWKQQEPASPEPYIVLANYYIKKTVQPTGVSINSTKGQSPGSPGSGGPGDRMSLVDPKTGKEVGVLEERPIGPRLDAHLIAKYRAAAEAELAAALKVAPNRLDIMLGRALVLDDAQDWKALSAQMETALQRASTDPDSLKWLEDKPPPRPAPVEAVNALHSKIVEAFNEQSAPGDRRGETLAMLGVKYFPKDVKLLSDAGTSRAFAHDWQAAAKYYERAVAVAPDDSIVLGNLARTYLKLGDYKGAESNARKVIGLNRDPRAVEQAREILRIVSGKQPQA